MKYKEPGFPNSSKIVTARAYEKGESLAIYYDDGIISAPGVNAVITDGNAQITGSFTFEEADALASTIRIGGLKLELEELTAIPIERIIPAMPGKVRVISNKFKSTTMPAVYMLNATRLLGNGYCRRSCVKHIYGRHCCTLKFV